jgi:hypothetical protein
MSNITTTATNGVLLPLEDLQMTVDTSVAGTTTCTVVYAGATYRQAIVTVGTLVTVGQWVQQ